MDELPLEALFSEMKLSYEKDPAIFAFYYDCKVELSGQISRKEFNHGCNVYEALTIDQLHKALNEKVKLMGDQEDTTYFDSIYEKTFEIYKDNEQMEVK